MQRSVRATLVLIGALALLPSRSMAQAGATISGRVTSEAGTPLPNASIFVRGTTLGTLAREDGSYSFTVPAGQLTGQPATLVARLIGYRESTVQITLAPGTITHDFTLAANPVQLEGIVVTALGIARDKRSLGVAQQSVNAEELTQARETNLVNALSGKVAGVEVSSTGAPGGSSRIVIRGQNSITGNNQPLFVIDGIPIDNSAPRIQGLGGSHAIDYGNTAQDINPNDIESISILKGANAAALYGSRAANGVIVITTKTGKGTKGLGISASQNLTFEQPLRLPEFQNVYGQGSNGQYEFKDGKGGGISDNVNRSWGPPMDGRLITQWWSNGQPAPWLPAGDNVRDFFDLGRTATTNAAVTAANERADLRLGLTNVDQHGMYPTNTLRRVNAMLNGGAQIGEKLRTRASLQYVRTDGRNRPQTGYNGNSAIFSMIWAGRQNDLAHLKHYKNPDGTQAAPSYTTVNNPYWNVYMNPNFDTRDRVIGTVSATYQVTDWMSAMVRTGTDWYRSWTKQEYADGNIAVNYSGGAFFESIGYSRETNTDFLLTVDRDVTSKLSVTVNAGGNQRINDSRRNEEGTPHLVVPGTYNISNSAVLPQLSASESRRRVNSLYGQAQLSWNNYLFVDLTGRNDWSSTLPEQNRSYFYPSVSGSLVFTDALPSARLGGFLSYGKLRASWAQVGNDADPYQLQVTYTPGDPFGSVPRFAVPNQIPNANLKPEKTRSWEVGAELRFLRDRLSLDATYYDKLTENQIIPAQISAATGFTSAVLNAGSMSNKGVELQLSATPIQTEGGFSWDVTVNYARNRSEVLDLYPGLQSVVLGTYWGLSVEARKGQPYGTLFGNPFLRDSAGNLILKNGLPQADPQQVVLGHYTPDWVGGLQNTFRYRGVDFSFLVDTKQGGKIFSTTKMFGNMSGVLKSSLYGRENGKQTLAEGGGFVIPGVNPDGTPNTTKVTSQAYFNALFQLHESAVYDASFVKLREVKLGYTVPARWSERFGISSLYVAAVGRNLWLHSKVDDIDPEAAFDASNVQGIEFVSVPAARSIGFMVSVRP
jgi:TonB-linked SusC/RagA family outer membrane protein